MPQENKVITFDNKKTSVEKILVALKKGNLKVKGKPMPIR